MRCLAIATLACLSFVPLRADGQHGVPARGCVAASEHEGLWSGRDSADLANPIITGVEAFRHRVEGQYRMLLIQTEGSGIGKMATEAIATLRFATADSMPNQLRSNRGRFEMDLLIRRRGYLHQSLKPPARNTRAVWTGRYNPPDDFHFYETDPRGPRNDLTLDDGAAGYHVSVIDDSTGMLRGRWSASAILYPEQTPVGTLTESRGGYFCAWRVQP